MTFDRSSALFGLLFGAAALLAAHHPAAAGGPSLVSGPSPFAKCKSSRDPKDRNYPNSAVGPLVTADPSDPLHLVAVWQQDPWFNGLSRGLVSATSRDGGLTWRRAAVPGTSKCSGGTGDFAFDRSTSPAVTISPDGTSFAVGVSLSNLMSTTTRTDAVLVNRSADGGVSWGNPIALTRNSDWHYLNGLASITADPNDKRYVYAAWTRAYSPNGLPQGAASPGSAPPSGRGNLATALLSHRAPASAPGGTPKAFEDPDFTAPAFLARTTDGGQTWEPAKMIYDPGRDAAVLGNQVVVLNDGTLLVFFTEIFDNGDIKLRFAKSTDHGATFGSPDDVAPVQTFTLASPFWGVLTPDRQLWVRDAMLLFQVALDRATGRLYLTWEDYRQDDISRIAFTMSSDTGASWSTPVIISKTPGNVSLSRQPSFLPAITVAADSRVIATYYDFRNDPPRTKAEIADAWAVSCDPKVADCRSPAAWGTETRLTPTSLNLLNAPLESGGINLGAHEGVVAQGNGARAVFTTTAKSKNSSIVTAPIR